MPRPPAPRPPLVASSALAGLRAWFDTSTERPGTGPDWVRVVPYIGLHLACLAAWHTGASVAAVMAAVVLYVVRMFAITAFYHRCLSHRAFKTSRAVRFVFALVAASAAQRGPLWWASHHRHHHGHADRPGDAHSPHGRGLLWAHTGWFLARENFATRTHLVRDLASAPELRFLDRYDALVPLLLAAALYGAGEWLAASAPGLGTNGPQLFVWGFCISTVALHHATFTVNSFAHTVGRRRYATGDESRNSWWIALLTLGEGWHNNHHHYPAAARQGFHWWEIDLTWYVLRGLAALGIVRDLRPVPAAVRDAGKVA